MKFVYSTKESYTTTFLEKLRDQAAREYTERTGVVPKTTPELAPNHFLEPGRMYLVDDWAYRVACEVWTHHGTYWVPKSRGWSFLSEII